MSEKRFTVLDQETGERFENIFLACGFSEEEAAEMMKKSDARVAAMDRRERLIMAMVGKRKKAGNRRMFPTRA